MNIDFVTDLLRNMMHTTMLVSAPLLGVGIAIGLVVAVFMAATQINEPSLQFVPKMVALGIMLLFVGPWMLDVLVEFMRTAIVDMELLSPSRY